MVSAFAFVLTTHVLFRCPAASVEGHTGCLAGAREPPLRLETLKPEIQPPRRIESPTPQARVLYSAPQEIFFLEPYPQVLPETGFLLICFNFFGVNLCDRVSNGQWKNRVVGRGIARIALGLSAT